MTIAILLLPVAGAAIELGIPRTRGFAALITTASAFVAACFAAPVSLLLLATGLGAVSVGFSMAFLRRDVDPARLPLLYACMALFVAAAGWVAVATDLLWAYVAVEATTLASAPALLFHGRYGAAFRYLLVNTVALSVALIGFVLAADGTAPAVAGVLLIVGLGTKAGLVPLHGWLPDAYAESPTGFAALFSGIGTKVPLVVLARVLPPLVAKAPALGPALVVLACVTMVVGVVLAFGQDDLRRLLAYSSVSQMGYIALGLGVGGYAAAELHIVSHAVLKALLFFCAGALWEAHGTASITELKTKPHAGWIAVLFLLGALGLGGAPPLPAFWSKFALFAAAARSGYGWAAGIGIGVSLLTITLLVRAGAHIFLERAEAEGGEHGHDLAAADD